jgi:hypothetical protein
MRHPGGYACITEPDRPAHEFDTFTCAHCNRVTHVKARQRPEDIGGLCKQCMGRAAWASLARRSSSGSTTWRRASGSAARSPPACAHEKPSARTLAAT